MALAQRRRDGPGPLAGESPILPTVRAVSKTDSESPTAAGPRPGRHSHGPVLRLPPGPPRRRSELIATARRSGRTESGRRGAPIRALAADSDAREDRSVI